MGSDIDPKDQRAIVTAVNNFEAVAERCKRAEAERSDAIKLLRDFLKIASDANQSLADYTELAERVEKIEEER